MIFFSSLHELFICLIQHANEYWNDLVIKRRKEKRKCNFIHTEQQYNNAYDLMSNVSKK